MSEFIAPENREKTAPSPATMARALKTLRGIDAVPFLTPKQVETATETHEPQAGDIIVRDGKEYMLTPVLRTAEVWEDGRYAQRKQPYTYRQYYSHTFEDPGTGNRIPGPGWDSKFSLHDSKLTTEIHDRTFTEEELRNLPNQLPEEDALFVSDLENPLVEEYRHYLEQNKA